MLRGGSCVGWDAVSYVERDPVSYVVRNPVSYVEGGAFVLC